jgi:uncharacterized protein YdiU (UPF0061 family)
VLGLTIDYGPYGWLEDYDPDWTPNTTDAAGRRYRYGHQPGVVLWNLSRLGSAIVPLVGSAEALQGALDAAARDVEERQRHLPYEKLGLDPDLGEDELATALPALLQACETDMTIFFRKLADVAPGPDGADQASEAQLLAPVMDAYYAPDQITAEHRAAVAAWLRRYQARLRHEGVSHELRRARMNAVNPKYVLRNYLAQLAIDKAEQGDASMVHELLDVLRAPYAEQPGKEALAAKRPEWARHRPGCSMLSCSS